VPDTRPFLVHATALRRVAGTTRHEHRHGVIEGLGTLSVVVPDGAEVEAEVTLSSYPGGITATGTVTAPWTGECRRCGGEVTGEVTAAVRERYVPSEVDGTAVDPEADVYLLTDNLLDLEPLARDAVLLELPLAPLCSADCRGLCPQCGTNRNLRSCTCEEPVDPRWAALAELRDVEGGGSV